MMVKRMRDLLGMSAGSGGEAPVTFRDCGGEARAPDFVRLDEIGDYLTSIDCATHGLVHGPIARETGQRPLRMPNSSPKILPKRWTGTAE